MLSAFHKGLNSKIYSFNYKNRFEISGVKGDIICPYCEGAMFPRGGRPGLILHFYHQHNCSSPLESHPESPEHLLGKTILAEYLRKELENYTKAIIEIEYAIPEAGEHGRIADVAAVFPSGYALIFECQLASITPESLNRRTKDYLNEGADVIWWLGGKANNETNRNWCREEFGACYTLEFRVEEGEPSVLFEQIPDVDRLRELVRGCS